MSKFVGGLTLPPVSLEFIQQLEAAFPRPEITPGFDRDEVLWKQAQSDVVEWIKVKAHVKQNTSTGATVKLGE